VRLLKKCPHAKFCGSKRKRTTARKVFVFDGHIAVVARTTWDPLSEEINSEVVAAINDKPFAQQTRLAFLNLFLAT
jgi:phosphatidylserine/phosphatidylglycerophosphate/cardiolipin synthase-like enzyme